MNAKEFGEYLKKLRKEKNLTIRQLDLYSGVSNSYISQMERGARGIPSPEILQKLAKPLGVEYEELMEKSGYLDDIRTSVSPHLKKLFNSDFIYLLDSFIDSALEEINIKDFLQSNGIADSDISTADELKNMLSFEDKLEIFLNSTDNGKQVQIINYDKVNKRMDIAIGMPEEYSIDLSDDKLVDKLDLYYEGMELTKDEKIEFLAIARGIFSARRALKGKS